MPLSQSVLKGELLNAFNKISQIKDKTPQGVIHPQAADALASAYDNYVLAGQPLAGILQISVPPVKASLTAVMTMPSLAGFPAGLPAYWAPVIWTAPGFIPVNPTIPTPPGSMVSDILNILTSAVEKKSSAEDVADQVSSILHTYTTGLLVTATTISVPPVTSTFPVV